MEVKTNISVETHRRPTCRGDPSETDMSWRPVGDQYVCGDPY